MSYFEERLGGVGSLQRSRLAKLMIQQNSVRITNLEEARRRKKSIENKGINITTQLNSVAITQKIWTHFKQNSQHNSFSKDLESSSKEQVANEKVRGVVISNGSLLNLRPLTPSLKVHIRFSPASNRIHSTEGLLIENKRTIKSKTTLQKAINLYKVLNATTNSNESSHNLQAKDKVETERGNSKPKIVAKKNEKSNTIYRKAKSINRNKKVCRENKYIENIKAVNKKLVEDNSFKVSRKVARKERFTKPKQKIRNLEYQNYSVKHSNRESGYKIAGIGYLELVKKATNEINLKNIL